jgi:site-specific recombinase XerC
MEKVREYERDLDLGLDFDARRQTVGEYLDRWLREAVRGSVVYSTYAGYERAVRLHLKPELGRLKLRNLTKMHVQSLVNRKAAELSPATVRHLHVCLSKAMNQAVDWDLLPKNPAHRVKLPYNPRVSRQTLSRENVSAFFEADSRPSTSLRGPWQCVPGSCWRYVGRTSMLRMTRSGCGPP